MNIPAKSLLRRIKHFTLHSGPTRVRHFAVDNWEVLSGQRDRLTPPLRLQQLIGGGNFREIGEEFVSYFLQLGGLQPWHRVLDVGCGSGRMAVPLTRVLDGRGSYDGLEIVASALQWCNRSIHRRFKNFRFHHADIVNRFYNSNGKVQARDYTFPFPDSSYDFVFLTSVFTHLLHPEMERYLEEIARVMKPCARALITFFVLNEESLALVAAGGGDQRFAKYEGETYTTNPQIPEGAVGYTESGVRELVAANGLAVVEPIHFGSWCGRDRHLSYQDIVILTKNA